MQINLNNEDNQNSAREGRAEWNKKSNAQAFDRQSAGRLY